MKKLIVSILLLSGLITVQARDLTFVATNPPGNQTDTFVRALSKSISANTGWNVTVENVVGGDHVIGAQHFINKNRDLFYNLSAVQVWNPLLKKDLPYSDKDFDNLVFVGSAVAFWVVPYDSPLNDPRDLVTKMPDMVGGYVPSFNYNLTSFVQNRQVKSQIVNYKGNNQIIIDMINGSIKAGIMAMNSTLLQMVKDRRLKIVGSTHHSDLVIDGIRVPSVSRVTGVPQFSGLQYISGRPGMDPDQRSQLVKNLKIAIEQNRELFAQFFVTLEVSDNSQEINDRLTQYRKNIRISQ